MNNFLAMAVIILIMIVLIGFFNEKVTKLTYEIALMLFSIGVGGILLIIGMNLTQQNSVTETINSLLSINLEDYLMTDGILCFMLFAGSCHMRLFDFKKHARAISLLSIGATLLGAIFYGVLFYAAGQLFALNISFPVCLMFGSITAPTDPIAATSILKKFNLPPNIDFIIEGESLLNDGVGVALFVCFSGLVTATSGEGSGFFEVMGRELFGAILVGIVVTVISFPIFRKTADNGRRIFVSLMAVSLAYLLCEKFDFSGAIASVVCGVLFSAFLGREEQKGHHIDLKQYDEFWEIMDNLLNSILYVMLGLTFFNILKMPHILLLSLIAIVANLLGRSGSVGVATLFIGKLPDGYNKSGFIQLLTWGGLRGGLCVALAMSTKGMIPENIYYIILGGTFAIVFFTTIIQGLTIPALYHHIEKKLKGSET
ncbi:MAG: sodium:proton antiporter [Lachnospiraceae bacterium]|nr:sodium:proton antiporter [Lachnospiraceae bacterium]